MQNLAAQNDLLNINIGISASPVIAFQKLSSPATPVPDLSAAASPGGFHIFLEVVLPYDSLGRVANGYIAGKRFAVSEGLIKQHVVVKEVAVTSGPQGRMLIKADFTGSFNGTAFFTGNPVYNPDTETIDVRNLDYDLQTKNLLLKTAKWLFASKIEEELKKHTTISLTAYLKTAQNSLNAYLNQQWTKGVRGAGSVNEIKVISVEPLPQHILIKTSCTGTLRVEISEIDLNPER